MCCDCVLVKKHVYQGSEYIFSYYGKPHTFNITAIQVIENEKSTSLEGDISKIADVVGSLDLDKTRGDTSVAEFYNDPSTPGSSENLRITSTPAKSDSNFASFLSHSQSHDSVSSASRSFDISVTMPVAGRTLHDLKYDIENLPEFYVIIEQTDIIIEDKINDGIKENKVRFCDIGGLDEQIKVVKEVINLQFKQSHLLSSKGTCYFLLLKKYIIYLNL